MSREIKFRSWDGKKMRQWGFIEHGFATPPTEAGGHKYPHMQFTGLHDKNGKEIYEGDIITFNFEQVRELRASDYRVIDWIANEGKFNWVDAETRESTSGWSFCKNCSEKYSEIVGNIYENQELIK